MHHIKTCTANDSEKIEQVLVESWLIKNTQDAHETFVDEIHKWDHYFLAIDESNTPLWIVSWKTEWRPKHWLYELFHIWVIPKAKWTWVSKDLFDALVDYAKDVYKNTWHHLRKFYLKSWEKNEWAHNFYKKMGMTQKDSLTSHFSEWRRELIFHLFFDEEWNVIEWK